MIVFLRRIPGKTKTSDIIAFIEPALKRGWFAKKGVIDKVKVLQLKDTGTKISEYHGLVTITPDAVAERVIKRLNRKLFLGKRIAVREFQRRDWHNDPRMNQEYMPLSNTNRRDGDRRRSYMEAVADLSNNFSSNKNFHRQQF